MYLPSAFDGGDRRSALGCLADIAGGIPLGVNSRRAVHNLRGRMLPECSSHRIQVVGQADEKVGVHGFSLR